MQDELECGLRGLAALSQLHAYVQEKDLTGECILRVNVIHPLVPEHSKEVPLSNIHFYFEFPADYSNMCSQVYVPEAEAIVKDVEGITVELIPNIKASNRYVGEDVLEDNCGFAFIMPERWWNKASQHVMADVGKQIVNIIDDTFVTPLKEIANDLYKIMYDFVGVIQEAGVVRNHLISDDPDDPNYREIRDWSQQHKKEIY
jgi:hypothetical protein